MAEQTTSDIEIAAPLSDVMAVIADFASYPLWAQGVSRCTVLSRVEADVLGRAHQVRFELDAGPVKDTYVLEYTWEGHDAVNWTLVEGQMLRAIDGEYRLVALPTGGTRVEYRLSVELAVPMIGMLRRKAEKVVIDSALRGLSQRVEALGNA